MQAHRSANPQTPVVCRNIERRPMTARQPDRDGHVPPDGIKAFYEVGGGRPGLGTPAVRSGDRDGQRCNTVTTGGGSLTALQDVVKSAPLAGTRTRIEVSEALSGARLERLTLADGRRLVLKHLPAAGDWLTRLTNGLGRAQWLWDSGLLRRLAPAVEHGVLAVKRGGDHDVVVMDDLSDRLWPPSAPLGLEQAGAALAGLAEVHQLGIGLVKANQLAGAELCSVGARYGMTAPAWHRDDAGPHPHPNREWILKAWETFFDSVEGDVAAAVAAVHADPSRLGRKISAQCLSPTVLHGDPKPENLGVTGSRLTAIDWGELTGIGPREVDVAWFALMSTRSRLAAKPDEIFLLYEQLSGRTLDPVIVDLACVGSLAQMGCRFAHLAHNGQHPEARQRATVRLAWWSARVHAALARGNTP